ncbi:hypothetical protein [Helicobacter mehlei]|uniref:hypothetical protein n=1 Tax=Helicobacter mehlei TaxID=2316080 RepID=UPI00163D6DB8|nr:hypothetical protein [Helicobacter mehlei]
MHACRTPKAILSAPNTLPKNILSKPLYYILLALIVGVSLSLGIYKSLEISVSYKEALFYFSTPRFLADRLLLQALHAFVERVGCTLPKDLVLRLPGLFLHGLNIILIYHISHKMPLKKPYDPLFVALTFALLPGVQLGAILLGKVSLLLTLSFCALLGFYTWVFYPLVVVIALADGSTIVLLMGLCLYTLKQRYTLKMALLLGALGFNLYYFRSIKGMPEGFFIDTLVVMFVLYSPCLCLYYPYALYAQVVKNYKQDSLIGIVATTGFALPLLLSLRQELPPQFLSYGAVGMPILLQKVLSSIRLHLPVFRSHYYIRYSLVFGTLFLESAFLWGGYNPFVSTHYIAKELATALKAKGIDAIHVDSEQMALRLKFYGIQERPDLFLIKQKKQGEIKIRYKNKVVASYAITNHKP